MPNTTATGRPMPAAQVDHPAPTLDGHRLVTISSSGKLATWDWPADDADTAHRAFTTATTGDTLYAVLLAGNGRGGGSVTTALFQREG